MYDQDNPNQEPRQDPAGDAYTLPAEPITPKSPNPGNGRKRATAAILGSLLVGGAAGAAILGPLTADAASPTASGAPTTSATPSTGTTTDADGDGHGGRGGPGGHVEAISDNLVAAKAIGITEADLTTALQGGQTMADVAKAHNVDVQKVIDALVADELDELAAEVKAGTLTQAQADAKKPTITQRMTDRVNGTKQ